jgi:hypothetical protein
VCIACGPTGPRRRLRESRPRRGMPLVARRCNRSCGLSVRRDSRRSVQGGLTRVGARALNHVGALACCGANPYGQADTNRLTAREDSGEACQLTELAPAARTRPRSAVRPPESDSRRSNANAATRWRASRDRDAACPCRTSVRARRGIPSLLGGAIVTSFSVRARAMR